MIKKIIFFVSLFFLISPHVFADTVTEYYIQDTNSTKETYWYARDSYTYPNQYILFANENEKYVTLSTCLTGNLDYQVTGLINGSIEYYDTFSGASCNVRGYNGAMYYYIFYVNDFYDAGNGNFSVYFNLNVSNPNTYRVEQDIFNVSSSLTRPTLDNYDQVLNDINGSLGNINDNINDTNEKLDDLNSNIINEDLPNNPDFSDLDIADDTPISDLVLMPINYLNKIINSFDNSCKTYTIDFGILGSDYQLHFPCIKVENWIGSSAWNIIDGLICFFMIYEIGMLAVSMFNDFTSLRDTYDSLYTPRHAKPLGKHTSEVE